MKLILQDVSEIEIDLEDVEIRIFDKKNPERSYIFNPIGGYILFERTEYRNYRISMESNVEVITIKQENVMKESVTNALINYRG